MSKFVDMAAHQITFEDKSPEQCVQELLHEPERCIDTVRDVGHTHISYFLSTESTNLPVSIVNV